MQTKMAKKTVGQSKTTKNTTSPTIIPSQVLTK